MPIQNSNQRNTEYSLRSYLDNNQPAQEGMCLQLLPILGPFTECIPRRPKGGADGKRDIQAMYKKDGEKEFTVWGAVGFINDASSISPHRTQISKKFHDDLEGAIRVNPNLQGFVFLTNVDITPSKKDELKNFARTKGEKLSFVEIYDFEILRNALDSVSGLVTRFQFLEIPMSETEQIAFFAQYGKQLQDVVSHRFDLVGKSIEKIEFLASCNLPLNEIYIQLSLNPFITPPINDYACILKADSIYDDDSFVILVELECNSNGGLSELLSTWNKSKPTIIKKTPISGKVWNLMPIHMIIGHMFLKLIELGGARVSLASFLLGNRIEVFCTKPLREFITHTKVELNNYLLVDMDSPTEEHYHYPTHINWPESTPIELSDRKWVTLTRDATHPHIGFLLNK